MHNQTGKLKYFYIIIHNDSISTVPIISKLIEMKPHGTTVEWSSLLLLLCTYFKYTSIVPRAESMSEITFPILLHHPHYLTQ